jgi:hypothetical protein
VEECETPPGQLLDVTRLDAAAALSTITLSGVGAAAPPPIVAWSLEPAGDDTYRLTNTGNAKAWHVKIESDESLVLFDVPEGRDLDATEAVIFYALPDLGTRDMTITATWNGDEHVSAGGTWRYPPP